jgi:mannose-6-phosphate isomerase-like protein (cupin superfamily)
MQSKAFKISKLTIKPKHYVNELAGAFVQHFLIIKGQAILTTLGRAKLLKANDHYYIQPEAFI